MLAALPARAVSFRARFVSRFPRALRLVPLALVLAACGGGGDASPDAAAARARVCHAIDALRRAPPEPLEARLSLVAALEQEAAGDPETARARDGCARAYRLLIEGSLLAARAGAALGDARTREPEVQRDVAEAEAKIRESARAMPACDEAAAALALTR